MNAFHDETCLWKSIDFTVTWRNTGSKVPSRSVGLIATCLPISALEAFMRLPPKLSQAAPSPWRTMSSGPYSSSSTLALNERGLGRKRSAGTARIQGVVQALMMIVAVPPGIEGTLGIEEIVEGATIEQLGLERAVEALVLAMALRI